MLVGQQLCLTDYSRYGQVSEYALANLPMKENLNTPFINLRSEDNVVFSYLMEKYLGRRRASINDLAIAVIILHYVL